MVIHSRRASPNDFWAGTIWSGGVSCGCEWVLYPAKKFSGPGVECTPGWHKANHTDSEWTDTLPYMLPCEAVYGPLINAFFERHAFNLIGES